MILGTTKYPSRYGGLGRDVKAGLTYLAEQKDLASLPLGHYAVDGEHIFFDIFEVESVPAGDGLFEAHKNCIDIHITLKGEEWFGHAVISHLSEAEPYSRETDTGLYSGEGIYLQAPAEHFLLFMPEDAHKSGIFFKEQGIVRKLVMKIKLR